jgi:hypothetical protein
VQRKKARAKTFFGALPIVFKIRWGFLSKLMEKNGVKYDFFDKDFCAIITIPENTAIRQDGKGVSQ